MPKLEKDLWIEGGYYVDFDELSQFRIIGPNNHLYCGLVDIPRHKIRIDKVESEDKDTKVVIRGSFPTKKLNLYYPAQDDIRTFRELSHRYQDRGIPYASFLEIRKEIFDRLIPSYIRIRKDRDKTYLVFRRYYAETKWYGITFEFPKYVKIEKINVPLRGYRLSSDKKEIKFNLEASTNDIPRKEIEFIFLPIKFDYKVFGKYAKTVRKFWKRTEVEIRHLIEWNKTSGDRFGTIFPRDWIEAADIGVHDLTEEARAYMYEASLKNINDKGEGWHEDVVGEYKYEHQISGKDIFDRHMIDIEPHIVLGLKKLPEDFLVKEEVREKFRKVVNFLLKQARENKLITFKKLPKEKQTAREKYWASGNWRDSDWAYKKISPIIAPLDVNAVFYPEVLKVIKENQSRLKMKIKDIDRLIKKWNKVKSYLKFVNEDGRVAYALTLYNVDQKRSKLSYKQLRVNNLDEAYYYTYSQAKPEEIKSFCERLLDPEYFYTKSGPLLIAQNNIYGYTTQEYHGLVIWMKQTAFAVLGLSKHLKFGMAQEWDKKLLRQIKSTILKLAETTMYTVDRLQAIPELHYDLNGEPHFYTDQPYVASSMSKVQLWSAVGFRRMIRKYYELKTSERYKI